MTSERLTTHAVILGTFCMGFGLLLALTYLVTSGDIALRSVEDRQTSLAQVIPVTLHDNNLVADTLRIDGSDGRPVTIYRATRAGRVTAVAFEISGPGYAGPIRLMLGVDADGRVLGVRAIQHKETPGLGDKIEPAKSDWITRFTGLALGAPPVEAWRVKKDGGQFDQFAGATITPRGVVSAIRGGLQFFAAHRSRLVEETR